MSRIWHMANLQALGILGLGLSFLAALGGPLVAGCSSSVMGSGDGGAGQGGDNVARGGNAGVGGDGTLDCGPLVASEQTSPVDVRLVNNTGADLFVQVGNGSSCGGGPFSLADTNGKPLVYETNTSCGGCQSYSCTCTVTYTCVPPPTTRIAPQGVLAVTWGGGVLQPRNVPAACFGADACPWDTSPTFSCNAWVKAPAATVSATLHAGTQCSDGPCTCTPDASGVCELPGFGNSLSGAAKTATASYTPGATSVDLVFQ